MSQEYYVVCHECRKKIHIGCVGFSGLQFWWRQKSAMKAFHELLKDCFLHIEKLAFVWEQSKEDEEYDEINWT